MLFQVWPATSAVRELATKIKALRKGVDSPDPEYVPFVAVDLKKRALFFPSCCLHIVPLHFFALSVAGSSLLSFLSTCR